MTDLTEAASQGWVGWSGGCVPVQGTGALGLILFAHETLDDATARGETVLDHWPWFGENEQPIVVAYCLSAPAKAAPMREDVTQADALVNRLYQRGMAEDDSCNVDSGDLMREAAAMIDRLAHTARPDAGDEDVERVACAIYNEDSLDGLGESTKSVMMDRARAALAAMREGVDRGMVERIEAEARRYAAMYPESSDGRNTFVIFANWVAGLEQPR